MSSAAVPVSTSGPVIDDEGVTFVLGDRNRRLAGVRLLVDLGLDGAAFTRERTRWWLRMPRPPVDRLEYLFEIEDHNGHRETILDPGNAQRAPRAFGDKSALAFPGYAPPEWLDACLAPGRSSEFEVAAPLLDGPVSGQLWRPLALAEDEPAALLIVHDGPEYAKLGGFLDYVAAAIARGTFPPLRVALLDPGERNVWYSAHSAYASTLADVVLPALPPATTRIGVGVSLGALAMLHLHRSHPGLLDGMLLQSGSFFVPELDPQEEGFSGFAAVTEFATSVHTAEHDPDPVPVAMTCGVPEENLANNQRMARTLERLRYPVRLATVRDSHNYTAWRDALHPNLTELVTTVTGRHAP